MLRREQVTILTSLAPRRVFDVLGDGRHFLAFVVVIVSILVKGLRGKGDDTISAIALSLIEFFVGLFD